MRPSVFEGTKVVTHTHTPSVLRLVKKDKCSELHVAFNVEINWHHLSDLNIISSKLTHHIPGGV